MWRFGLQLSAWSKIQDQLGSTATTVRLGGCAELASLPLGNMYDGWKTELSRCSGRMSFGAAAFLTSLSTWLMVLLQLGALFLLLAYAVREVLAFHVPSKWGHWSTSKLALAWRWAAWRRRRFFWVLPIFVQVGFVSTAFLLAVGFVVAVSYTIGLTHHAAAADKALCDLPALIETAKEKGTAVVPYLLSLAGLTSTADETTANQLFYTVVSSALERARSVLESQDGVTVLRIIRVNIWFVVGGIWLAIPVVFCLRMWRLGKLASKVWGMAVEQNAVVEKWFDPASSSYRVGLLNDKRALKRLNPTRQEPKEEAAQVLLESSSREETMRMWADVVSSARLTWAEFFLSSLIYGQTYSAILQLSVLVIITTLAPTALSAILIFFIVFSDGSADGRMAAFYSYLLSVALFTLLPLILRAIVSFIMARLTLHSSKGLLRPVQFSCLLSIQLLTGLTIGWVPVPNER